MTRERLWPAVLLTWIFASTMLCLAVSSQIAGLRFPDPDDAMRLLEVRDWMAGQSWWDVAQHRLNGGNFPMHWSRLVDLPLAAAMVVLDPLVGLPASTKIAMTLVPLMTLLVVMAMVGVVTRRLAGDEQARLAMVLTPLSIPLVYQLRPMRIDHHGWQIALALTAVAALIGPSTARRGFAAGTSLGVLLTISLEGLPIAAIITAIAALSWAFDPSRRSFLAALMPAFFVTALTLHGVTRGPAMFVENCDAVSPAWLAGLGVAALTISVAAAAAPRTLVARLVALGLGAAASGTTLLMISPSCLSGPFASLDPLVRSIWYEHVPEGLPLWRQTPAWMAITVALPLVGIVGSIAAHRRGDTNRRLEWTLLIGVLAPSILLACLVNRTGATANALALPGAASLLLTMLTRARRIPRITKRVAATTGALLVASPGLPAGAAMSISDLISPPRLEIADAAGSMLQPCETFDQIRALGTLPSGTVFLPLDVTPDLIATTGQKAISGGYHRNVGAMHLVLAAFTGAPTDAERLIRSTRATYVAGCPLTNETELYKHVAPNGFWARLERGERFDWLQPVVIPGSPVLAWRVIGSSRKALSREASSP